MCVDPDEIIKKTLPIMNTMIAYLEAMGTCPMVTIKLLLGAATMSAKQHGTGEYLIEEANALIKGVNTAMEGEQKSVH